VNAVVLVGGEGTRLRPLTTARPKQLLPVAGVPMLDRVLASLVAAGIDGIVLSLGYRPDDFVAAYAGRRIDGVPVQCVVEPDPLDTGGAIRFAAVTAGIDDTFVAVNGDVLTDLDVAALVAFHRSRRGAEATIALVGVDDPSRFGVVVTDGDGRVTAFVEKPPPGLAPSNQINAGAYVMEPSVLARIAPDVRVSVERSTFPDLVAAGTLFALAGDAYWLDTGTPEAYLQAHADLLGGVRGGPPAPSAHLVAEGLWTVGPVAVQGTAGAGTLLGTGATVAAGAVVRSSYIGCDATVDSGATVTASVVLDGAHVHAGAVVDRSVVGPGASVGEGARVEDVSVIADGSVVPAGAVLHAARVPEVASR
jgi:mannose-1-phosphate guanylyltransferase